MILSLLHWRWILFWALLFSLVYFAPTEGKDEIRLTVRPRVAAAPATIRATIRITPSKFNRWVSLVWACPSTDGDVGSTFRQIDELNWEQTAFDFTVPDLPACSAPEGYTFEATLYYYDPFRNEKQTWRDHQSVKVVGRGSDPEHNPAKYPSFPPWEALCVSSSLSSQSC